MARNDVPGGPGRPIISEVKRTEKVVASGSTTVALAGLVAMVLVILSFIGILRMPFAAIATIAIGFGLFVQGLAITRRHVQIREELAAAGQSASARGVGTGMTVELFAGLIGIALGIIALAGGSPHIVLSIAAIVFGVALIMGSSLTERLNELAITSSRLEGVQLEASRVAAQTASGLEVLVGIGALVLGILSLLGLTNIMLVLVALLIVGAALFVSGGFIGRRSATVAD
jgi:hypothetical protein